MSFFVIDSTTAAAVSAAATQRAQLEALAAPWAGGAVTVRWMSGSTLLRTQTYPAFAVDTVAEPYRFTFGRFVADSHVATGTADRVVLRAGSTDIVQASVGSTVTLAGAIKELCPPNLEGVSILANASLPITPPPPPELAPFEVQSSGITVLSTNPRAVYRNGYSYFGAVSNAGAIVVSRYDHAAGTWSSTAITGTAWDVNDHAGPSLYFREDGRLQVFYSKHNDTLGLRYQVATTADSIAAFGSEVQIGGHAGSVTYSNPRRLEAADRLYLFSRSSPNAVLRYSTDDGATWSAEQIMFDNGTRRPYPYIVPNGPDRFDCVLVEDNPKDLNTSVWHCYAKWEAGALNWYTSSGSPLSLPIDPDNCTRIYTGAPLSSIWQDMVIGPDGHPWVTVARFNSTTSSDYLFTRWTGSAWTTPTVIASGGHPLYQPEWAYCAGASFDPYTPTRVYVGAGDSASGPWNIDVMDTADNGATWTKVRDLTSDTGSIANARPIRIEGLGPARVTWWRGTYTTYTNYSTALRAAA